MIKTFKERAPTVQAVEFTNVQAQSPEVANLIGATSMLVDMGAKRTVFTVQAEDKEPRAYTAEEGQIIGLLNGQVVIMDALAFYSLYESV